MDRYKNWIEYIWIDWQGDQSSEGLSSTAQKPPNGKKHESSYSIPCQKLTFDLSNIHRLFCVNNLSMVVICLHSWEKERSLGTDYTGRR